MDPAQFDRLVQSLGLATSRRGALAGLLSGLLTGLPGIDAAAKPRRNRRDRDQKRKRRKKKRGGGEGPDPTQQGNCCGTKSCADPEPGSTRSECDFAGRSFAGQDLNGSTFRGIDGREANFNQTDNQGSIFAEACLQGARFRRARLDGSTWGDACLFDADFTGADLGGDEILFDEALFCGTVMPDGTINDRDCGRATPCCQVSPEPGPTCQSAADCADQPCQTKSCQNGQCAYDEVFSGPSPNDLCTFCCDGDCCLSPANQCNPENSCCAPNCEGRVCGPDGCGGDGTCGPCSVQAGRRCTAAGQCVCDTQSCPDGCCDANADCWPGDSNARCGTPGGTCATCTAQEICREGQCTPCSPNCTCTGQSYCTNPDDPAVFCADIPQGQDCLCVVTRAGQPFCAGGASEIPNGCVADADCRNFSPGLAGAVCVNGAPGNDFCAATAFCATPCPVQDGEALRRPVRSEGEVTLRQRRSLVERVEIDSNSGAA